jgi:hypothetical protein
LCVWLIFAPQILAPLGYGELGWIKPFSFSGRDYSLLSSLSHWKNFLKSYLIIWVFQSYVRLWKIMFHRSISLSNKDFRPQICSFSATDSWKKKRYLEEYKIEFGLFWWGCFLWLFSLFLSTFFPLSTFLYLPLSFNLSFA